MRLLRSRTRAVVVREIPREVVSDGGRSGLLELLLQPLRGLDINGIGDDAAACPDPFVVSDDPPVEANPDPFEVCGDVDEAADRGRVDMADAVLARSTNTVVVELAQSIIQSQTAEMKVLERMLDGRG